MTAMQRTALAALFALLVFMPAVHADVGPSPEPPVVIVHLVKDGQPDASVAEITYECMGEGPGDNGAVTQRTLTLECSAGTCNNSGGWFYKFNPCFSFPGGEFTYRYNGSVVRSEEFNYTTAYKRYEMTIDAPSGHVVSKAGTSLPSGCCGSAFLLAAVFAGAAFAGRA